MAELSTLARPYAKAMFEYAEAEAALEDWSALLSLLSAVVSESRVQQLLSGPDLTTSQQASAVIDICGDALNEKGQNVVHLLAENRRLKLIPNIAEQYEALKLERQKSVDVEFVTVAPMDKDQQDKLVKVLSSKLERTVNVTLSVDKSLLGGVLIRAGDTIIDGTVRGRLGKLAEVLSS